MSAIELERPAVAAAPRDLPHTRMSRAIDGFLTSLSNAVSWIWVLMVLVITVNVAMRYVFGEGRIEFEELQWHLYAIGFLVGLSSCYVANAHVRIDVAYALFSPNARAWIEFYGILLLLAPFLFVIVYFSVPFVLYSVSIREVSEAPGGLPLRWAIKACLLVAMILLSLAAIARFSRVTSHLFGAPRALASTQEG